MCYGGVNSHGRSKDLRYTCTRATPVLVAQDFSPAVRLEADLRAKLHFARVLRAEDASEIRRPEDPVGQIEVRSVEHVEDLPTELNLAALRDGPRLRQNHIEIRHAGADHAVARRVPEGERRLECKRRRV